MRKSEHAFWGNLSVLRIKLHPVVVPLLWCLTATRFLTSHLVPVGRPRRAPAPNNHKLLCANQQHLANFFPLKQRAWELLSSVGLPARTAVPLLINEQPWAPTHNRKVMFPEQYGSAPQLNMSDQKPVSEQETETKRWRWRVSETCVMWIGSPDGQNVGKKTQKVRRDGDDKLVWQWLDVWDQSRRIGDWN